MTRFPFAEPSGHYHELIDAGAIRAVTVRQPGARRGIKLLNRRSVLAYLAKLDAEQNGQNEQQPAGEEAAHES